MSEELLTVSEQSMKSLESSSDKNNKLLIFFYLLALYIFTSVLSTTDLMLLLPTDTFKMPLIGFDLNLVYFYVLAPILLLLLHFNILFNYHEHLQKLHAYKGEFVLETMDSSMYNYVYILMKHGSIKGIFLRILLRLFIYIFPLLVFISIYHRFAAYHHDWITLMHLIILGLDVILIYWSIYNNDVYYGGSHGKIIRWSMSGIFALLTLFVLIVEGLYYYFYFNPVIEKYDSKLLSSYEDYSKPIKSICSVHHFFLDRDRNKIIDCFPRIVVTDKDIVKISKSSVYIPSLFAKDRDKKPEKNLILEYGARVNLSNRNLRYADLHNCILTRADMHNTQLQSANLKKTHLQAVKFDDAQLQDAKMREAELQNAVFVNTQLQYANLVRSDLTGVEFYDSNISHARMQKVKLLMTVFGNCYLKQVNFNNAQLNEIRFIQSNLQGASFTNAKVTNVTFYRGNLDDVDFNNAKLNEVKFSDINLSRTIFENTKMANINLIQEH